MRRFVIPDIRGDLTLLRKLMDKIQPTSDDNMIFLGSYLGPGHNSKGVVEFLVNLSKTNKCTFIRGCYEFVFAKVIENKVEYDEIRLWGEMQGKKVFDSYKSRDGLEVIRPHKAVLDTAKGLGIKTEELLEATVPLEIPYPHIQFFQHAMGQWYDDDTFPFVCTHSGGHPGIFKIEREEQTVFSPAGWWEMDTLFIPGKTIIFSHVPQKKVPFRRAGKLGLDLGCGFGGPLCCFEMYTDSYITVKD